MLVLHTTSLHKYGLNRIFEFAKKAGYDGIEIGVEKSNYDTQNAEYIKDLSREYKMPVVALHAPVNGSIKSINHVVDMAAYLKCPIVSISTPKLFDFKLTNWLKKEASALRKKKDIQLTLINAPGKTILGVLPERAMNNLSDLKKFGMVTLDCSSTFSKRWDLIKTYKHLQPLIVHIHLSNVHRQKEYALPNEGSLPIENFLAKVKANNYKGALSLMVRPSELEAGDDERVIKSLKKVKEFVDEYFK